MLTPEQRHAIEAAADEGLTRKQISERTGISDWKVRSCVDRHRGTSSTVRRGSAAYERRVENLVRGVAAGKTIRDAAKNAQVSERTAYRISVAPDFAARVKEAVAVRVSMAEARQQRVATAAETRHRETLQVLSPARVLRDDRPPPPADTLAGVLARYCRQRLDIKPRSREVMQLSVRQFERWALSRLGRVLTLEDLTEDLLLDWMAAIKSAGRVARTVNNHRQVALTLWEFGFDEELTARAPNRRKVRKLKEPKRIPQAWTLDEMGRILHACRTRGRVVRTHRRKGRILWDWRHWLALILTLYDSCHRISAILEVERSQFDPRAGTLRVRAEQVKQNADIVHTLSPETVQALEALPDDPSGKLLAWPIARPEIWRSYKKILTAAGLSATRRDAFHKVRRTSYSFVFREQGLVGASRHAGHSTDMSAAYLDPSLLELDDPLKALPRPALDDRPAQPAQNAKPATPSSRWTPDAEPVDTVAPDEGRVIARELWGRRWTQQEIAVHLGVCPSTIKRWLREDRQRTAG